MNFSDNVGGEVKNQFQYAQIHVSFAWKESALLLQKVLRSDYLDW